MSPSSDPLAALTAPQLAALLGCSARTIRRQWSDGSLPFIDGPSGRRTPRWLLDRWQRDLSEHARLTREPEALTAWRARMARRETGAATRRATASRTQQKTRSAG